jgi:DNA-binding SARP family transcriptional activator
LIPPLPRSEGHIAKAIPLKKNALMGIAIFLLGKPRVERGESAVPAPRGQKVWALLGYLLRSGTAVSRRHLADLLFADAQDPQAALRWNLSELRKLLGTSALQGDMLNCELDASTYVDIHALTRANWSQALRVPGLGQVFLEGLQLSGCAAFQVWLETERRHLQATAEAVLREAAMARLATGHSGDATELAARLVRHNPLDEDYQVLLVRCLAASGDGVGAARQATACRELFQRELGVQPGNALNVAMNTATATPTARPATGRMAAIAQLEAGEAAIGAGVLDAGLQCLRRAVVEADATGDAVIRTRTRVALGGALVHAARGRDEEGATALHEALAIGKLDCAPQAAAASRELGYVEFLRGRYERALVLLREAAVLAGTDQAEQTRIAIVQASVLSDTAHYPESISLLRQATRDAEAQGDKKRLAYALSMLGRSLLLRGELAEATVMLDQSIGLAKELWTAFLPWPQSLRAEADMLNGNVESAAERFDHAFALGCQLGDPCWEGIAGRGRGCVALSRGDTSAAIEILLDAISRSARLPDGYLWAKAYALEALCNLAIAQRMPEATIWTDELQAIAARTGMREFSIRVLMHKAALGDASSGTAAKLLIREVDNPLLHSQIGSM